KRSCAALHRSTTGSLRCGCRAILSKKSPPKSSAANGPYGVSLKASKSSWSNGMPIRLQADAVAISPPQGQALGDLVERFEETWHQGSPPDFDQLLGLADPVLRAQLLLELVQVDLEYRWRRKAVGGDPWTLDNYVKHYPALGPVEQLPVELIAEEYRV